MGYSTQTQIQAEFKSITFSTTSAITASTVASFILQIDAIIDTKLALKYVVPVTGTTSLTLISMISATLVSEKIKKILEVKTENASKVQSSMNISKEKMMMQMLEDIVAGKILLTDAILKSASDGVRNYTEYVENYPIMDVQSVQW